MPSDIRSQGVRVTTLFLDTVADDFPGGGTASPGFAPGQLGQRVTLAADAGDISLSTNRYEGTAQYVQTLSTDTTLPALGMLAFWSDRNNYIVSTAGSTAGLENWAGVYLGALPVGKFGYIKVPEGGRTLVNFSGGTPTAGAQAVAQTSAIATTAASGTDIKGYHIGICQGVKTVGECAVVALKGGQS